MNEIDFLPAEYWNYRRSQRDQWYLLLIGVATLVLLSGNMLSQSRKVGSLGRQVTSLENARNDAAAEADEVRELEAARTRSAADARRFALLGAHPSLSRVLVTIAASCPDRLSLTSVRVKPERAAANDARLSRPFVPTPSAIASDGGRADQLARFTSDRLHTETAVELVGVAATDLDVTDLIGRLERSDCFAEVTLGSTDAQAAGGLREFKIQCRLARTIETHE